MNPLIASHGVNSPQECEDLRKENKYLSNEIHMERIVLRTESELTMRNLRSLNQELQAQVKEVHPEQPISQEIRNNRPASTEEKKAQTPTTA